MFIAGCVPPLLNSFRRHCLWTMTQQQNSLLNPTYVEKQLTCHKNDAPNCKFSQFVCRYLIQSYVHARRAFVRISAMSDPWCLTNSAPKSQRLWFFIKQRLISSETIVIYNTTVKQSLKNGKSPFLTI